MHKSIGFLSEKVMSLHHVKYLESSVITGFSYEVISFVHNYETHLHHIEPLYSPPFLLVKLQITSKC